MGLLRYGEKRLDSNRGYKKEITVKKIGWRRIAKNTCRFNWMYVNPNSDSDAIIEPYSKKGRTKVELLFVRANEEIERQPSSVRALEFFYNLIFLLRRIVAFLLPILLVAGAVLSIIKRQNGVKTAVIVCGVAFFLWIACIILEGVFARSAEAKLKKPSHRIKNRNSSAIKTPMKPVEDDDGLITLKSKNGEDIDFVEIAGIAYGGNFYAILQPVELLDGMQDDEALVFKVTRNADGENNFEVELNDDIIDGVFAEYNRLLDKAESKRTA